MTPWDSGIFTTGGCFDSSETHMEPDNRGPKEDDVPAVTRRGAELGSIIRSLRDKTPPLCNPWFIIFHVTTQWFSGRGKLDSIDACHYPTVVRQAVEVLGVLPHSPGCLDDSRETTHQNPRAVKQNACPLLHSSAWRSAWRHLTPDPVETCTIRPAALDSTPASTGCAARPDSSAGIMAVSKTKPWRSPQLCLLLQIS